jgi:uncharacterized repeat protein (TIGR01451 family)
MLILTPAAFADGATSPTGMVSVSVASPVVAGIASTYTITATNTTPLPMTSVVAEAEMPSGVTLRNISGCTRLGGNQSLSVLCSMPGLAPGASETATVSLVESAVGTYQIPFGVSALEPVPGSPGVSQGFGDSLTLPVDAQPGPTDIQVTGSSTNGSPPIGNTFSYAFQVKNNGPLPASGVTFDDPLPGTVQLTGGVTIDNGSCLVNPVTDSLHCDIGNLGVGQQSDIVFSAAPSAAGVFANTAAVAMAGPDTHPASDSFTVTVQPK